MRINKKRILGYIDYFTQGLSISDRVSEFIYQMGAEEDCFKKPLKYNFNISDVCLDINELLSTLNNVILIENKDDMEELKAINMDVNRFINEYMITCIGDNKLYNRISQKFNLKIDDVYAKNIYLSYEDYDELLQCIDQIGITDESIELIKYKNTNGTVLFLETNHQQDINDLNSKGFSFESDGYVYEFQICKKDESEDKFDFDAARDFKVSLYNIPF